jgi:hypothetical protein
LDIFRKRGLSSGDLFTSFAAIAFPVHVWAIINILYIFPAWLLRFSVWELAGAVSYPLVDTLLESCLLWIGLLILGFVLPKKWFADKFVALSAALVWLLAAWAVLVQFTYKSILELGLVQLILGLLLVIISFGLAYWLVQHYGRLDGWIKRLAQGLVVLTYFYLVFDLLGLAVVILRNL